MKKTQKETIIDLLIRDGKVTRNQALSMFISRLGAIICDLKKGGFAFESRWYEGDYIYYLKDRPVKTIQKAVLDEKTGKVKLETIFYETLS